MWRIVLAALPLMGLASLAQSQTAPQDRWMPRCPASGVMAVISAVSPAETWRASREFFGPMPSAAPTAGGQPDPRTQLSCLMRDSAATFPPGIAMSGGIIPSTMQIGLSREALEALRPRLPVAAGDTIAFERMTFDGGGSAQMHWRGVIVFDGFVPLAIAGAQFQAARLRLLEQQVWGADATERTYHYDIATGVLLKEEFAARRGAPARTPDWHVTMLSVPPPPVHAATATGRVRNSTR